MSCGRRRIGSYVPLSCRPCPQPEPRVPCAHLCSAAFDHPVLDSRRTEQEFGRTKLMSVRDKTLISTYEFSIRVCAAFDNDGTPLVGFLLEKLLEPSRLQQFLGRRLSAELIKPPHNIRIRERGF